MFRFFSVAVLVLSSAVLATDAPQPYAATATAVRTGDKIRVDVRVTQSGPGGVTTTLSKPSLLFEQGRTAQMVIGTAAADSKGPENIESGVKVDVVSIKGQDRVLMLSTVVENSLVVWADVATIPVTVEGAGGK
jgi:hypothetical protein